MILQKSEKQGGFTLIELMIVVTIIGILASIAVPAYRDYTIRTRVGETASVFYPVKTETSIYYSQTGSLPSALGDMKRIPSTPASYKGDYVATLTLASVGPKAMVTVTLETLSELGDASGNAVEFIASAVGHTINWRVSGSVPEKYRPGV